MVRELKSLKPGAKVHSSSFKLFLVLKTALKLTEFLINCSAKSFKNTTLLYPYNSSIQITGEYYHL